MRVLAVDPGEKRLGISISDPTGTIANPLTILAHVSRWEDAAAIVRLAQEQEAGRIIIGQALGGEGEPTEQSKKSARLAAVIRKQCELPVELWDESGSTLAAQEARRAMGAARRNRSGHLDELAATYILQTYLDAHASGTA